MTREEAIAQLKEINREVHIYSEAVDMAIEALAQPDLEDIKNQALNCSAELLKLVALIGRHNKEDEP